MLSARYYLLLTVGFLFFWPAVTLPMFTRFPIADVLTPLGLLLPFVFAFITGARHGRRPWPVVAIIAAGAAALLVGLHLDDVAHDSTLVDSIPFMARLIAVPSITAVAYCLAGAVINKHGVRLIGIFAIACVGFAVVTLWSALAWYDGEPFTEMFNLEVLEMGAAFTAVLALMGAIVALRSKRVAAQ